MVEIGCVISHSPYSRVYPSVENAPQRAFAAAGWLAGRRVTCLFLLLDYFS
jgi:hypothetical protein